MLLHGFVEVASPILIPFLGRISVEIHRGYVRPRVGDFISIYLSRPDCRRLRAAIFVGLYQVSLLDYLQCSSPCARVSSMSARAFSAPLCHSSAVVNAFTMAWDREKLSSTKGN